MHSRVQRGLLFTLHITAPFSLPATERCQLKPVSLSCPPAPTNYLTSRCGTGVCTITRLLRPRCDSRRQHELKGRPYLKGKIGQGLEQGPKDTLDL
jgi:hypothetical protein